MDDAEIETRRSLDEPAIGRARATIDAAAEADGTEPIGGAGWEDLIREGRADLTVLLTADGASYGQVTRSDPARSWLIELAVRPAARTADGAQAAALLRAARRAVAGAGGGPVSVWVSQPRPADLRAAAAAGLVPGRVLYQMRRSLPVEAAVAGRSTPLPTRPYRPGADDDAWLAVNNRAFAWHPEQGGWTRRDLDEHRREPWFDADGFRLHEEDGRLAGFCWTKVHGHHQPVLGEIYVIATDPDFAGRGLGRRLTLAGLDHLAGRGVPVGMLSVDAANLGAVKLYVDLGFQVHHVDQVFTADEPAAGKA